MSTDNQKPTGADQGADWLDLSVVSDPLVVQAQGALLGEWRMRKRWDDLASPHRRLHHAILRGYLQTGHAPSREDLQGRFGQMVETALDDLVARDLILLHKGEVAGAYPFTSRPARHLVEIDGQEIAAMCAIDALGAGAMARRSAQVRASCAHCDAPISLGIAGRGLEIDVVSPDTAQIWAGVAPVSGCAADTQCQSMLLFCCPAHLEGWRVGKSPEAQGYCLTPAQALQLGAAIFRPFLDEADTGGPH
jgi:alkylmercury lyase-like protein